MTLRFNQTQTSGPVDLTDENTLQILENFGEWSVKLIAASITGAEGLLTVTVGGVLAHRVNMKPDTSYVVPMFDGIHLNREQRLVTTLAMLEDTPPPAWVSSLNVAGLVRNYNRAKINELGFALSANGITSPLPGEPQLRGKVIS